jgi:hypothetical protein
VRCAPFLHKYTHVVTLCVFRTIAATDSEAKRPVIPREGGHLFRTKAAIDSDRRRPPLWIGTRPRSLEFATLEGTRAQGRPHNAVTPHQAADLGLGLTKVVG